jgi:hypothetical protein
MNRPLSPSDGEKVSEGWVGGTRLGSWSRCRRKMRQDAFHESGRLPINDSLILMNGHSASGTFRFQPSVVTPGSVRSVWCRQRRR